MKKVLFAIFVVCLSCSHKLSENVLEKSRAEKDRDEINYLFVEGLRYKYQGNNSEALKYFEECLKKDSHNDAVYFSIAEIMLNIGKTEEAKRYLIKAKENAKGNIWYYLILSEIYHQSGKNDSALLCMEEAYKLNNENPEIKLHLAQLYTKTGKYKQASVIYKEIEENYGLNESNYLIIVKSYLDSQDYEGAKRILNRMIEEYPDEKLYVTLLAEVYRKTGDTARAHEIYNDIYNRESENPQVLLWMANFLIEENDEDLLYDVMIRVINNEEINPEDKIICIRKLIGNDSLIKSDKLRIDEIINEAEIKLKGDDFVEMLKVEYYEKTGKSDEAVEILKNIIKTNRGNYYAWEKLLLMLLERKNYNELFNYAAECTLEFNMSYLAKIMYANAAIETGRIDIATEEIKKAKILAGNKKEELIQTMILEADLYYRKKEYEKAFEIFEEALKIDPENYIVLNNYSYYLAESGENLDKAYNMIIKVVARNKENTIYLDTYAWVLYKKGKNNRAIKIMMYVIYGLKGDDAEYFEHLGFMLKKAGKCSEAKKYWQIALEKDDRKDYLLKEIESCKRK